MVELLFFLVGTGFLAMVGTFGYQTYLYLKYGEWIGLSVTYTCGAYLDVDWCKFPQTWIGLHKILSELNVGLFAFALSLAALWLFAVVGDAK